MKYDYRVCYYYFYTLGYFLFASVAYANCTGCGEDGHQMCPIEEEKEIEAVFAVCVFADGTFDRP